MRGTVNVVSRPMALILVFVIGFVSLAGFMVGGGYLAFTKVSIEVLQEFGVDIKTDSIFDEESAQVQVSKLTIQNIVDEMRNLYDFKDEVSLTYLKERYGIKIVEKIPDFIDQKYWDMPLAQLFTNETKDEFLDSTFVGDLYKYEKLDNPEYNAELDEGNPYIWKDSEGNELTGISATMASYTLGEVIDISKDPSMLTGELSIADVLNLKQVEGLAIAMNDESRTPVDTALLNKIPEVWVDENGAQANVMISFIAPCKVTEVEPEMDNLTIGDITSHVLYADEWYEWEYDAECAMILLTPKNDISTELGHVTVKEISGGDLPDAVNDVHLSAVLGYELGEDNKWYKNGEPISGVMATIADSKVGEIDSRINTVLIGEIAGYTYNEDDGKWYNVVDGVSTPATGILAALADLSVDEVTEESKLSASIQSVHVADIMGYQKNEDGKWCTAAEDGTLTEVTGIMSVIADSAVNNVSDTVDNSTMAAILSFKQKVDENGDPVIDSVGNPVYVDSDGEEVHVLMQKIARTKFTDIDSLTDDLTLADIISEEDRTSGYMSLISANTKLDNISAEVNKTFQESTIYRFISADILTFSSPEEKQRVQDAFDPSNESSPFAGMTITELLVYITTP